jgi:hypothetical protein
MERWVNEEPIDPILVKTEGAAGQGQVNAAPSYT